MSIRRGAFALVVASVASTASADVLSVSFVGNLTEYFGPSSQDPFNASTPLGAAIANNPDLGRFDGQFIVNGFDGSIAGTQTFTFGPGPSSDPNVQFFLHTPILERLEAVTTRLASGNALGVSENTKILLPRAFDSTTTDEVDVTTTGFFGTGTLTVVDGVPVSFSYNQGENTLNSFDFRFNPLSLEDITIQSGSEFSLDGVFDLEDDADQIEYGFNTDLSAFPGSTVLTTTKEIIDAELAAGTLLTTRASSGGVPIADPFAAFSGDWIQYNVGGVTAAVTVVPAPAAIPLLAIGGWSGARRRR